MVYDSMYPVIGNHVKKQIAALGGKDIKVNMLDIQMQYFLCFEQDDREVK